MKKRILSALLALAMVSTCLVGCGGNKSSESKSSGKVTKITIAVPDPEASYIYQAATEFADRAKKYSNNTLEFTVSGNGSLYGGDTAAGIKQLSAGSSDHTDRSVPEGTGGHYGRRVFQHKGLV